MSDAAMNPGTPPAPTPRLPPQTPVEPIADSEKLARFILRKEHVRQNGEVKPDAFMPHPHLDCSVTRHAALTEPQIWARGDRVAAQRQLTLFGRADVTAQSARGAGLDPVPDPIDGNPEHANIKGWALDNKPAQKQAAQLLVKYAVYSPKPAS